jgi:hypothetical protein
MYTNRANKHCPITVVSQSYDTTFNRGNKSLKSAYNKVKSKGLDKTLFAPDALKPSISSFKAYGSIITKSSYFYARIRTVHIRHEVIKQHEINFARSHIETAILLVSAGVYWCITC